MYSSILFISSMFSGLYVKSKYPAACVVLSKSEGVSGKTSAQISALFARSP